MLHRRLAALALGAALLLLPATAGHAFAADPPVAGTTACDTVVDADQTVIDARAALADQEATLAALNLELAGVIVLDDDQQAQLDTVTAAVGTARATLTAALGDATARLCVALPTGTTTTTPPPATTTTTAPPTVEYPADPLPSTTTTSSAPTTTVDPIADDGTTAVVGGRQVRVVPEGSADTGAL